MDEKKYLELMENGEFVAELLSKEEPEDAQKLFADNGVELSIDEIKWLGSLLAKSIEGEVDPEKILSFVKGEITKDDLSDDELNEVSGGVLDLAAAPVAAAAGAAGTGLGVPIAIGIGVGTVVTAGVIIATRSWGSVKRGASYIASDIGRGVSRAARSVGRALTSRW